MWHHLRGSGVLGFTEGGCTRTTPGWFKGGFLTSEKGPSQSTGARFLDETRNFREVFRDRAEADGQADAILAPQRPPLTFQGLLAQMVATRDALNDFGMGRGDRVAVVLPNGPEMAVCSISVMASAILAPLNPDYTAEEFHRYFAKIEPKAVIVPGGAETPAHEAAKALGLPQIELAYDGRDPAGTYTLSSDRVAHPAAGGWNSCDDLASIMLTSGTTSRSKLVPLRTRHLLIYARMMRRHFDLRPSDRCLHVMPMFHGHGLKASLLNPLTAGSSVVCLPKFDVETFFEHLREFEPTWLTASFTILQAVLRAVEENRDAVERTNLRFIRSGSGRLDPKIQTGLEAAFRVPVIERYSMTETGSIASNPLPPGTRKLGSVGVPTNCEIRLVSENEQFVGPNEEGEVVVRGPSVFEGYLDDPEANRAAFIEGWFRTGDLGRVDDDGYLTITGRVKELINRGGEKVSPLEVEKALHAHPEVLEPCVFAIAHPTLGEEVVAAVVLHPDATVNEDRLRDFARQYLAPFKVPRRIVFAENLPKGPIGKLDRKAAARAFASRVACAESTEAKPPSALEGALSGLWASVLGRERVALTDDFFLLGGDSLLAVRLVTAVRDVFGVELAVESIFDSSSTVQRMAAEVERARNANAPDGVQAPIPKRPTDVAPPLSFQQQRLWFLDQLEGESGAYVEPKVFRVRGALDVAALERAVRALVGRHEVLRTRFPEVDGAPYQIVTADRPGNIAVTDLSDLAEPERETAARESVARQIREPFDLSAAPPIRFSLIKLADDHHLLLVIQHHIISDGTSTSILNRDLASFYNEALGRSTADLPSLPIQYADYAAWQRDPVHRDAFQRHLAYWKEQLHEAPNVLDLPTDRPRPMIRTGRPGSHSFEIDAAIVDGITALVREERVTRFIVLLAAFYTLLHRYSGQTDLVVGSPSSGRDRPEVEELMGFFINILPLRVDLSADPSFTSLLPRVRTVVKDALAHRDLPFDKLVEDLQPERSLAVTPIFQVVFNYRRADVAVPELHGLDVEREHVATAGLKYDIYVSIVEQEHGLHARLEYNRDLFDPGTAQRLARHYQTLLRSIVAQPHERLSRLPLLSESERRSVVLDWNQTAAPYPKQELIHRLFEEQAAKTPTELALVFGGTEIHYAALNGEANRLARYLRARGVGSGHVVGVFVERSIEMVIGILAVLKTGAAYLPLSTREPTPRLSFMLEDAVVSHVLTQEHLRPRLPAEYGRSAILLDSRRPPWRNESPENLIDEASDGEVAYVIYTSGSTGRPKGVEGRHQGAVNRFFWMWDAFPFRDGEVCCQKTALGFVDSVWEIFGPLLRGIPTVVVPDDVVRDPQRFLDTLAEHRVTRIVLVPSLLSSLVDVEPQLGRRVPRLRLWVSSGETLPVSLCRRFHRAAPDAVLLNLYGSSEVAADVTCFDTSALKPDASSVPIGRPIANTRAYVLDEHDQPVPIGVWGHLHISGDGLARGYRNRAELTAERFVANPLESGETMYRTGDRARWSDEGVLEHSGRFDDQIKIRGNRIEIGEIDAVLAAHHDVQSAVTVTRRDGSEGDQLVSYVVPNGGSGASETSLREHLRRWLPEPMVPSAFVVLDGLPLTSSGKVDRQSLPAPDPARPQPKPGFVAPRDKTEREMAAIWEKLLGVSPVGVQDSFFDLGGHSLLAVRLVSEIESLTGHRIPLVELFRGRTVEHIANLVDRNGSQAMSPFQAIQTHGSLPPFFAGGSHPRYVDIARCLGSDQPFYRLDVYALQSERVSRGKKPYTRIEDMAARFLDEIRAVQPAGPYYLGGGCEGAVLAFEIARRLQDEGEEIACLVMWQTPRPGRSRGLSLRRFALYRLLRQVRSLLAKDSFLGHGWSGLSDLLKHEAVEYQIFRAVDHYVPRRPFRGKLNLVRTAERLSASPPPTETWRELATEGAELYTVPGNHETWLQNHLDEFSDILRRSLADARERRRRASPSGVPAELPRGGSVHSHVKIQPS